MGLLNNIYLFNGFIKQRTWLDFFLTLSTTNLITNLINFFALPYP